MSKYVEQDLCLCEKYVNFDIRSWHEQLHFTPKIMNSKFEMTIKYFQKTITRI